MQIFKDAVNEILGGQDGVCSWAGNTLRTKALRLELWRNRDESDPDYNRWLRVNGRKNFDEHHANKDIEHWESCFSMVTDGQQRELCGMLQK